MERIEYHDLLKSLGYEQLAEEILVTPHSDVVKGIINIALWKYRQLSNLVNKVINKEII